MSWNYVTLDELGTLARGRSRHRPRDATHLYGGDYPFIQTGDVKAARLYLTDYSSTYNDAGLAQSRLWPRGTLCITIAANIAETAILGVDACFPDSVIGFIPNHEKADARFIKYLFDAVLKERYVQFSQGATQDNLSQKKLTSLRFPVPSIEEQRSIADTLAPYDELIECNLRRIEILHEIVKSLYREWFIDHRCSDHEHVDLKHGTPKKWYRTGMLEIPYAEFIRTNVDRFDGVKRYFATADILSTRIIGEGIECTYENRPVRAQKEPIVNSVWFARMKDTYKVLVFSEANRSVAERIILSSGFVGFHALKPEFLPFLFATISSQRFHMQKDQYCTGATQQALTNRALGDIQFLVPPEETVIAFGEIAQPIVDQIITLEMQNWYLEKMRQLLMPRLFLGEIAV